jgi:hypothetical protein
MNSATAVGSGDTADRLPRSARRASTVAFLECGIERFPRELLTNTSQQSTNKKTTILAQKG